MSIRCKLALGAIAVVILYGFHAAAQEPAVFRVGVIGPQASGTVGAAQQQENGIRAALEEAKKRWGLQVRIEACDDRSDPRLTLDCAQKLDAAGVDAIVGAVNSLCTLELPRIAAERHVPIVSAISTATRLTKAVPVTETKPTWFFRAALSDRYQMHGLAQWLSGYRALQPDEVAFVFEDGNEFVKNSSDEATRKANRDIYGWGLRQDFLDAEPWQSYAQKPIDVGINRGLTPADSSRLSGILTAIEAGRKTRANRPVKALGLFTLWDDAREIVTYIRNDANRSAVRKAFGLSAEDEPILFAGSGAFSAEFYRDGGPSVVGTYLLSPFFFGESSTAWREFRTVLASSKVDTAYPDPYLALGYDAMSTLASCMSGIAGGKKYGSADTHTVEGRRTALRGCLAAGTDGAAQATVTGLKGFDKTGEALRDLAQTTYILRVGPQNTLVPATPSTPPRDVAVTVPPWWKPDGARGAWLLLGGLLVIVTLVVYRSRQPAVSPPIPAAAPTIPTPIDGVVEPLATSARPPRNAVGEPVWLGSAVFFGSDPVSQHALQVARKACADNADKRPVILLGPPGVGKTQLARLIHKSSSRGAAGKPYFVVDCATITESLFDSELAGAVRGAYTGSVADRKGLLEAADGGTVLFDEIAEIAPELQARILGFLQNGEVRPLGSTASRKLDVRIVAATNKDLAAFRPDLWGRLSQGNLVIEVPPLDAHWWDIPEYVDGLLQRFGNGVCIADRALDLLTACSWRGNFRSLGCVNENATALGLLGELAGSIPGGIITPPAILASVGAEAEVRQELARARETIDLTLPPAEPADALFGEGMDTWFTRSDPRQAWEYVLDAVFNRLRGPRNENFLLATRDAKKLAVSFEELAAVLGLADAKAAVKSLRATGLLELPEALRDKELSEALGRRHRRALILFAKRTNFIRFSHEELAEVCGVNRTKYYNFYHYAFKLAEEMGATEIVPPMSRYVLDHKGGAERSDRRADFANPEFEQRVGQPTESLATLKKLQLLPGRARV